MALPTLRIAGSDGRALPRRTSLNKLFIDRLNCPDNKRAVVVYDNSANGLCIHVTKSNRSFYLYRKVNGRPMRYKLGPYPDLSVENARKIAMKHLGQIVEGKDPRDERRAIRDSITLKELFERYQDDGKLRHTDKTRITDKSRFETCFGDWEQRKIATISEQQVRDKHSALGNDRGKITANRAVQLLRRLFNFARLAHNPAGQKAVNFYKENERERFLASDELPRFFAALEQEPNDTLRDFFHIALLTGARRSNVQAMRWDELNLDTSTWTIPGSKMRSGKAMTIHLTEHAKTILRRRLEQATKLRLEGDTRYGEWVFPSKRDNAKVPHLMEPKFAWNRILERAKIKDLVLHDLRRTLGSWQVAPGSSLAVIGKSLGHRDQATTAIYARMNLDPVRASVDAAVSAMMTAAAGEQPKQDEKPASTKRKSGSRKKAVAA